MILFMIDICFNDIIFDATILMISDIVNIHHGPRNYLDDRSQPSPAVARATKNCAGTHLPRVISSPSPS